MGYGDGEGHSRSRITRSTSRDSRATKVYEQLPERVDDYTITDFLGRGGFGEVRVGENLSNGDRAAFKFVSLKDIADITAAERTSREIQCLQGLDHKNIIKLQTVKTRACVCVCVW